MKSIVKTVLLSLAALFPATALAAPGIPHQFYGTAKYDNGSPVISGEVRIKIDSAYISDKALINNGQFGYNPNLLLVTDQANDRTGKTLKFFVGDVDTGKTAVFTNGGYTKLDLVIPSPTTPSVPSSSGGGGGGTNNNYNYNGNNAQTNDQNRPQGQILGEVTVNSHPSGTLVLDSQTIYLIKSNKRFGFRTPEEFFSHGFGFNQTVPASEADKLLIQDPAPIKALEGTLVLDATDSRTVYMIGLNGTKRGFASASVFARLGYSFKNLPKINLTDYPAGPAIETSASIHPEGALVLDNKTVWWIRNDKRSGFESEAVFKTYGFSYSRVVPATTDDLKLPVGDLVKLRDGTLVKQGSAIYVISEGKKLAFASMAAFYSQGYKLENVITTDISSYEQAGIIK